MLSSIMLKIHYSLECIEPYLRRNPRALGPASLWLFANGFGNSFYVIRDELKNVIKQKDATLRQAIDEWKASTEARRFDDIFAGFRNEITHRGLFHAKTSIVWEDDVLNDTAHPVPVTSVKVNGGDMTVIQFADHVETAFAWWFEQIQEIERIFVSLGGDPKNLYRGMPLHIQPEDLF
ncbi:hypothetical protein PWG15_01145 [Ensifer adhaerens]|uniref:hypothetical protein n=1 Tax=Ensifer adhaerens TaxID=106592 RepID=UPI0023A918F2|nr:hypothetical protein [Ensifer adhaerens]WDZ77147.1 hypothetical protein PWG15_01145 [Ensifer adhaerens]